MDLCWPQTIKVQDKLALKGVVVECIDLFNWDNQKNWLQQMMDSAVKVIRAFSFISPSQPLLFSALGFFLRHVLSSDPQIEPPESLGFHTPKKGVLLSWKSQLTIPPAGVGTEGLAFVTFLNHRHCGQGSQYSDGPSPESCICPRSH